MNDYPEHVTALAEQIARLPEEDQSLLLSLLDFLEVCPQWCQEVPGQTQ